MTGSKVCTKCQDEKDLEEFTPDKRRIDGRGSWCRECNRKYNTELCRTPAQRSRRKKHYLENKEQLNRESRARWAANGDRYRVAAASWRLENRGSILDYYKSRRVEYNEFLNPLKSGRPCQDCGGIFPTYCMEFDHVRGNKRFNLGKMANHRREAVLEELDKCELVCCACHRIRTQVRKGDSKISKVQAFRVWLNELKSKPCLDCGKTLHHAAMDFDHVRGNKVVGIAQMWSWSRDKILRELEKCDLVCANCHRIRTLTQRINEVDQVGSVNQLTLDLE